MNERQVLQSLKDFLEAPALLSSDNIVKVTIDDKTNGAEATVSIYKDGIMKLMKVTAKTLVIHEGLESPA